MPAPPVGRCRVRTCGLDAGAGGLCPPHQWRLDHLGSTFPAVPLGEVLPLGRPAPTDPTLFDEGAS